MAADGSPNDIGSGVVREDGNQHREDGKAAVVGYRSEQDERSEPTAHPDDAEQRERHRSCCRRSRVRKAEDDEGDENRRKNASEDPRDLTCLGADQRQNEPDVAAEQDRSQAPPHHVQLVQRHQAAGDGERDQPPAAEPDSTENDWQQAERDDDA